MNDTSMGLPRFHWRLRDVMSERGVLSIAGLQRRLLDHYPAISQVQLSRIAQDLPARLNVPLLAALCHALECAPTDLLHWSVDPPTKDAVNPRQPRARPEPTVDDITRLLGPSYTVLQAPSRESSP